MSGIVLVVGLLMAVAGVYEMFAGNGDILSERGWSAFIAGAVLVSGGVVTMALGVAVRAIDRLRAATDRPAVGRVTMDAEDSELRAPAAAPLPVAPPVAQADLFHEAPLEEAPTAPVLAAAPIEHALEHEPHRAVAVPPPPHVEPEPQRESPMPAEPQHDDWLDHSFAELEREMAARPEPAEEAVPIHPAPVAAEPALAATSEPAPPVHASHGEPSAEAATHDPVAAAEVEPIEQATVSAREAPAASPVIGRYESEGTSYVMYADGSIDAQSEAGVYRFASMAELKTFIES